MHKTIRPALLLGSFLLAGCQVVGPDSIEKGRVNYNNAIEQTQKGEVFSNLIRIWDGEPSLFVDVSEIDASMTLEAAESSMISGGSIAAGSVTGPGVTYEEQPIIKYIPLSGQALVQQIATPINESSISELLDSDWHVVPVLQLTIDRMAPQYLDMGAALNAVAQLNDYHALAMMSFKTANGSPGLALYLLPDNPSIASLSDELYNESEGKTVIDNTSNALLVARKTILRLWIRLLRIYEDTQTASSAGLCPMTAAGDACLAKLDAEVPSMSDDKVRATFARLPSRLDLYSAATGGLLPQNRAPNLHTRSALGVLKAAVRNGGGISFFDVDNPENAQFVHDTITRAKVARSTCLIWPDYYLVPLTIAPTTSEGIDYPSDQAEVNKVIASRHCPQETLYPLRGLDVRDFRAVRREFMYLTARSFILVEDSVNEPVAPYISYFDGKRWFWIDNDDAISKLNFLLLGQLLTMQAIAPSSNNTTPVAITTH